MKFFISIRLYLKYFICFVLLISLQFGYSQTQQSEDVQVTQDSILKGYLIDAQKDGLYSQAYQKAMDRIIEAFPEKAYFYQQKAMPLIKTGKNDLAKPLLDKAVSLDEENYLDYRAFIKCIFFREYENALQDFELCKTKFGNGYVMDHSYDFYIALCKLQLNEFSIAENILRSQIEKDITEHGEDWVHYSNYFYLGIAQFEQRKFAQAILNFNKAIEVYPEFPDAIFYKSKSCEFLGNLELAEILLKKAEELSKQGYSLNESNSQYIHYPYQIRW